MVWGAVRQDPFSTNQTLAGQLLTQLGTRCYRHSDVRIETASSPPVAARGHRDVPHSFTMTMTVSTSTPITALTGKEPLFGRTRARTYGAHELTLSSVSEADRCLRPLVADCVNT